MNAVPIDEDDGEDGGDKAEKHARLARLLAAVRQEMDGELEQRARGAGDPWSEASLRRVWIEIETKLAARHARDARGARVSRLARLLTAAAIAVWNWRPLRVLLP